MTPKGAAAVATKGAMRGSDDTPPFAPAPGPLNDEYLHVDDDVHLDDMISWLDNPASGANNAAPPAHHLFGEARIHHSNNTHRSKLERALELIRASELEESPLESEQGLIQLWIPEDMADSHFGPRRLQNVVVGTTTKAGSSAESPDATAMESSSEEEGPATGTALATLAEFGERSKRYRFKVEGGLAEGLPGRVFVSGRPEMTLDVRNYGRENYLRINEAKSCGIKAAVGIPVYRVEGSWRETVAVVEISKVSDKLRMERLSCKLAEAFESVDLLTWGRETPSVKFGNWPFNVHVQRTSAILNTLVEAVCQLRGIAYVACWGKKSPDHHCLPSTLSTHIQCPNTLVFPSNHRPCTSPHRTSPHSLHPPRLIPFPEPPLATPHPTRDTSFPAFEHSPKALTHLLTHSLTHLLTYSRTHLLMSRALKKVVV